MSKLKFLYDAQGNKTGVLLPVKQFEKLIEQLEDLHDIYNTYIQSTKKQTIIPYEKIREELLGKNANFDEIGDLKNKIKKLKEKKAK